MGNAHDIRLEWVLRILHLLAAFEDHLVHELLGVWTPDVQRIFMEARLAST